MPTRTPEQAYQEALRRIEKAKKTNATELDLSSFGLTELPPEIGQLAALKKLYLQQNQLTSLPPEIGQLSSLKVLLLFYNQLASIPPEIGQLSDLQRLDLDKNQLKSLPPEVGQLSNLQKLALSGNQLTSIPPEIGQLYALTYLDISGNQLTSLPPEIGQLSDLKFLHLLSNQLTNIPPEIGQLQALNILDISYNQLTVLPPKIVKLKMDFNWDEKRFYKGIHLKNNLIAPPPVEIVNKGRSAVAEYIKSLEAGKQALNELKVLLVGSGGSGKTSLVKQLFGERFDPNESQTHGINIRKKDVSKGDGNANIKVHFWDFGGQQIMHATHQFFLSKRSLYILVLDGRKEEDAEYWLKHIESFGGNSPVLVVMNKVDEHPFDVNRLFLQDKYKEIKGFYKISCKKKKGIKSLSKGLVKALASVEHIQMTWAKSWFNVKETLQNMKTQFISYDKFKDKCEKEKITEK